VTVVLPAIAATRSKDPVATGAPEIAPQGERILVVEDEPGILEFVTMQLVSLGYAVEAVSTGPDASDLLAQDQGFDRLLTDVMLPMGMSGVERARRAREIKPD
jgi:CheY-like chemotaxis protein